MRNNVSLGVKNVNPRWNQNPEKVVLTPVLRLRLMLSATKPILSTLHWKKEICSSPLPKVKHIAVPHPASISRYPVEMQSNNLVFQYRNSFSVATCLACSDLCSLPINKRLHSVCASHKTEEKKSNNAVSVSHSWLRLCPNPSPPSG